ncbi:MAG: hypothetical protein EPO68_00340 [Planctomycetota bacterium]|nr:MAG: hypothetical protein EPO68_00340 [Planctomycetota bacterium]
MFPAPCLSALFLLAKDTSSGFSTWIKVLILVVLAPFWWPVLKAIYHDLNTALWREGGLFGKPPAGAELDKMIQARPKHANTLVSEMRGGPLVRSRGRRGARRTF